jgi:hypothetical protein
VTCFLGSRAGRGFATNLKLFLRLRAAVRGYTERALVVGAETIMEGMMSRKLSALIAVVALLAAAGIRAAAEEFKVDDDGFIRNWLILAAIPLEAGQSGADGLAKEQLQGEAKLKPKEGDKITVGGKDLTWKKHQANDYFFDLNGFVGQQTENSVAYAVCYVNAEDEMKDLKLKVGSDDQAKVYLNGKQLLNQPEARALEKDQDTVENVTLNKGANVLVFKVVNEGEDWSGCLRFVDKDGNPVKNLKISLAP